MFSFDARWPPKGADLTQLVRIRSAEMIPVAHQTSDGFDPITLAENGARLGSAIRRHRLAIANRGIRGQLSPFQWCKTAKALLEGIVGVGLRNILESLKKKPGKARIKKKINAARTHRIANF